MNQTITSLLQRAEISITTAYDEYGAECDCLRTEFAENVKAESRAALIGAVAFHLESRRRPNEPVRYLLDASRGEVRVSVRQEGLHPSEIEALRARAHAELVAILNWVD